MRECVRGYVSGFIRRYRVGGGVLEGGWSALG